MTLRELSQLYWLNREIEEDRRRLEELQALRKSDLEEKKELEKVIKDKIKRCLKERIILEEYIASIPDSLTRQIFALRFIDGLSWIRISFIVNNTADGCRMIVKRYIKKRGN